MFSKIERVVMMAIVGVLTCTTVALASINTTKNAIKSSARVPVEVFDVMANVEEASSTGVQQASEVATEYSEFISQEPLSVDYGYEYSAEYYVEDYADEAYVEEAPSVVEYSTHSYDDSGYINANTDGAWITASDFAWMGVHTDSGSGYSYTYYSENVLPGGGLSIPGRHVGDEGYVMDGDGNVCLASDDLPYGTVVEIPFGSGTGVVYDCGSGSGNLDVYVSW